ncbi:hypothetical protein [Ramlibacter sp.]|uniref:hypothetical protein n=1 Tax=Ramlibacter sp. TaxID=1917967 RepID=UPI0017D876C2|nr:hypothetical protein [Ramlibacter sp.]MBA2673315.1 hypothetical protein [Ramlibacter sp.]
MDNQQITDTLELHTQSIQGLVDNQLMLAAQVQVLQAAIATMLLHHPERTTLLRSFKGYMKISKESTPQLARHMQALEGGMLALLGENTEPDK